MSATQTTVREFMTPDPVTIDGGLSVGDAATRMFQLNVRHLPVYVGGHLVGILSDRDLARLSAPDNLEGGRSQTAEQACTPNPYVCAPDTALGEVATVLANNKIGAALVMEGGKLLGMFTVIDALQALASLLGGGAPGQAGAAAGDGAERSAHTPDARYDALINNSHRHDAITNPGQGVRVTIDAGIDNPDIRSDAGKRAEIRRAATTVLGRDNSDRGDDDNKAS